MYAGSLAEGGIVRVPAGSSKAELWLKPRAFGTASTFGMLADDAPQLLWVCSNDMSARGLAVTGEDSGSYLKGFNLRCGAGEASTPLAERPALCNDIAIAADGSVFVTNPLGADILRLNPATQRLEVWFSDPALAPANGKAALDDIALGADGNLQRRSLHRRRSVPHQHQGRQPAPSAVRAGSRPAP